MRCTNFSTVFDLLPPLTGGLFLCVIYILFIMQISTSVNTHVVTDSGAYTTDSTLNTVVGAGACAVASACVGGVIIKRRCGFNPRHRVLRGSRRYGWRYRIWCAHQKRCFIRLTHISP